MMNFLLNCSTNLTFDAIALPIMSVNSRKEKSERRCDKFTVFNAMKNKLVRLIFSLAKQGKKYDENYTYSLV